MPKRLRVVAAILPVSLTGTVPLTRGPEIEAEPGAAGVVERRLQLDVGIAVGRLAIIQRGRLPVDLDVAA